MLLCIGCLLAVEKEGRAGVEERGTNGEAVYPTPGCFLLEWQTKGLCLEGRKRAAARWCAATSCVFTIF
jgi:hypothetical protein